jgi:hypothetical protein
MEFSEKCKYQFDRQNGPVIAKLLTEDYIEEHKNLIGC